MPPLQRDSDTPRPYGRQAAGKTIKSLSLRTDVAAWAEAQAAAAGVSLSAWINEQLSAAKRREGTYVEETTETITPPPQTSTPHPKPKKRPKGK